jgi:hypothetical protein
VIGYLSSGSQKHSDFALVPFRQGLEEAGFVEGRNVAIEYRWGKNRNDRLPGLAADLVSFFIAHGKTIFHVVESPPTVHLGFRGCQCHASVIDLIDRGPCSLNRD